MQVWCKFAWNLHCPQCKFGEGLIYFDLNFHYRNDSLPKLSLSQCNFRETCTACWKVSSKFQQTCTGAVKVWWKFVETFNETCIAVVKVSCKLKIWTHWKNPCKHTEKKKLAKCKPWKCKRLQKNKDVATNIHEMMWYLLHTSSKAQCLQQLRIKQKQMK